MAVVNGNRIGLYLDNVLVGCLVSNSISLERELLSTTCKDNNGAAQVTPGGVSGTADFEGNYEPASALGFDQIIDLFLNATRIGIKQAVDDGSRYVAGYGYISNMSWDGPVNAATTFSGTITFDGPITTGSET
jgi:hypothetical protein